MNKIVETPQRNLQTAKMVKILLFCGIISSLVYIAADILAAIQWDGYNYTSQAVSELQAVGAPTRPLIVIFFSIYNLLIIAFSIGIWATDNRKTARFVGVFLIVYGIAGQVTLMFFPMHLRGTKGTISDTMHVSLSGVLVLLMLLYIGFGAALYGKRFRYYSIVTILILLLFGFVAGMDGHNVAVGLPTPWLGIKERINIYVSMLWIIIFAEKYLHTTDSNRFNGEK